MKKISLLNANFVKKNFLPKSNLNEHIAVHGENWNKQFKYKLCDKKFHRRHLASVHERNKLLECKLCEEKLSEKCHMNAHLPVHEKLVKFVFIKSLKRNTLF